MSLEAKDIVFKYKGSDNYVLNNFSASFEYGKVTAVAGNNGTGKTTLARVIMGILKPDSGEVILDGKCINDLSLAERGKRIGYVMQNPSRQIFSETVEEEVKYGLHNLRLSEEEIEKRVDYYLNCFGIADRRSDFPFAMSHGEKQRLVLAAIMAMKPEYLILDEPTASLDMKNKAALGELLNKMDCGVVIISHDSEFVDRYCDNIVSME